MTNVTLSGNSQFIGVVKLIVETGVVLNTLDLEGSTVLHWAAENGHEDVFASLFKFGAEVDALFTISTYIKLTVKCGDLDELRTHGT